MASYSDYISQDSNKLRKVAQLVSSSFKYFTNPELRAQKIENIMSTSNVDFCKIFSRLSDKKIFHVNFSNLKII